MDPQDEGEGCTQVCTTFHLFFHIQCFHKFSLKFPTVDDNNKPDIMYNSITSLWRCCGTKVDGTPDCDEPTEETFQAPTLDSLSKFSITTLSSLTSQSTKTSASLSPTSIPVASASLGNSSTTAIPAAGGNRESSSRLSPGAIGGISVEAIVGVICISLLSLLLSRARKRQRQAESVALMASSKEQQY